MVFNKKIGRIDQPIWARFAYAPYVTEITEIII